MITKADIGQYEKSGVYWVEASQGMLSSPQAAWNAMTSMMMTSNEISTLDKSKQTGQKKDQNGSLIAQGDKVSINAVLLNGWLSLPISIIVKEVAQGSYCRLNVSAFRQCFSTVDFLIESAGEGHCKLRYRQGYYYRANILGWMCRHLTLNAREIPEAVEIFNTWSKTIEELPTKM